MANDAEAALAETMKADGAAAKASTYASRDVEARRAYMREYMKRKRAAKRGRVDGQAS